MIDLDVLARRAALGWTRVAKGLCEAAPPEFVGLYKSYVREWTRDPHPVVRQFFPAPEVAA